jgi:hypothetical protein
MEAARALLEKRTCVWVGKLLLVSVRLIDTIYTIRKIGYFWYCMLPVIIGIGCPNMTDTNNEYIGISCVR